MQEARLVALSENGDETATEKLKEVRVDYSRLTFIALNYLLFLLAQISYMYMYYIFQVYVELEAIGAASAESRVRRILAVSHMI